MNSKHSLIRHLDNYGKVYIYFISVLRFVSRDHIFQTFQKTWVPQCMCVCRGPTLFVLIYIKCAFCCNSGTKCNFYRQVRKHLKLKKHICVKDSIGTSDQKSERGTRSLLGGFEVDFCKFSALCHLPKIIPNLCRKAFVVYLTNWKCLCKCSVTGHFISIFKDLLFCLKGVCNE